MTGKAPSRALAYTKRDRNKVFSAKVNACGEHDFQVSPRNPQLLVCSKCGLKNVKPDNPAEAPADGNAG